MTGVDRYTVHMTFLSPMGLPIFICFRFRYKFHLWEDLLRESLDLCHDFYWPPDCFILLLFAFDVFF